MSYFEIAAPGKLLCKAFHLRILQRFGNEVGTPFNGKIHIHPAVGGGEHDHGKVFKFAVLLDTDQCLSAVHLGHIDVQYHEAGMNAFAAQAFQDIQGFHPVFGPQQLDLIIKFFKAFLYEKNIIRIILCVYNGVLVSHGGRI